MNNQRRPSIEMVLHLEEVYGLSAMPIPAGQPRVYTPYSFYFR